MNNAEFDQITKEIRLSQLRIEVPEFYFYHHLNAGYRLRRFKDKFAILDNPIWDDDFEEYKYIHFYKVNNKFFAHLKLLENE